MHLNSLTVNLGVKNVNETVEFYQTKLGFDLVMAMPESGSYDWAMMKRDGVTVMFQTFQSLLQEYKDAKEDGENVPVAFYVELDDVHTFYEEIASAVDIYIDMHRTFYGAKEFAVKDNNGYLLVFAEHEKAE
jgi:uncharacterized glyoxalase superfamily protein PhnB